MKHTVKVSGEDYVIATHQKSQTVWTAGGDFKGNPLFVQDRSEATAIKRWHDIARSQGN